MRLSRKTRLWVSTLGWVVAPLVVDVSGIQGFWAVFAVCMGAIVWSLFLFRDEISRIRIVPDPSATPDAERPFWLVLPGVAMVLMALYPFLQLYLAATGYIKPLTPDDLLQTYIHDRSLYVSDLARGHTNFVVRDKVFENVTFVGPATITLAGNTLANDIGFTEVAEGKVENLFLEMPPEMKVTGIIVFDNCVIKSSRFERVQVAGSKELLEKLKFAMNKK